MHQLNLWVVFAGLVVVLLGLASARLESLPVSRPLLATAVGLLVGPVAGWFTPADWPDAHAVLQEVARFTLAISVFGIALRTPRQDYRSLLRPVALLLTAGMVAMWLASAGLAWALLGLSPLTALLLGAVLTPTDPVVASSIVTGGLAERSLPDRLRATLSLESGANDGLAYLIVLLPIVVMESATAGAAAGTWLVDILLVGVLGAVLLGAAIGGLVAFALHRAHRHGWVEKESLLGLSIALSLLVLSLAHLLGSDGILAAFAAGVAFNLGVDRSEEFEEQRVQEAIARLFNLPVFVLFGALMPLQAWTDAGWPLLALGIAVLSLRRPLALLATGRWLGAGLGRPDVLFLGWFGPLGVAALYYGLLAQERTGDAQHWHVASALVLLSVVAHGVTSAPGLAAYRRASGETCSTGRRDLV